MRLWAFFVFGSVLEAGSKPENPSPNLADEIRMPATLPVVQADPHRKVLAYNALGRRGVATHLPYLAIAGVIALLMMMLFQQMHSRRDSTENLIRGIVVLVQIVLGSAGLIPQIWAFAFARQRMSPKLLLGLLLALIPLLLAMVEIVQWRQMVNEPGRSWRGGLSSTI